MPTCVMWFMDIRINHILRGNNIKIVTRIIIDGTKYRIVTHELK